MNDYAGYKKLVSTVLKVPEEDVLTLRYKDITMIDMVLAGLGTRNAEILQRRFGLHGERQTLKAIGERFGVVTERIRQLETQSLTKLQHSSRICSFRRLTKTGFELQKQMDDVPLLERSVEHFDLSARTLNAVRHIGVNTLGELAAKTEVEMLKTKNFGRKSLFELWRLLRYLGLDFAPYRR